MPIIRRIADRVGSSREMQEILYRKGTILDVQHFDVSENPLEDEHSPIVDILTIKFESQSHEYQFYYSYGAISQRDFFTGELTVDAPTVVQRARALLVLGSPGTPHLTHQCKI